MQSRLHLASCYRQLELFDEAENECVKASAISSLKHTRLFDVVAHVHQEFSRLRLHQNRLDDALDEIDLAISIREQLFNLATPYPDNLTRYCDDWSVRGDILMKLDRLSEAETAYVKSFEIAQTTRRDHPVVKRLKRKQSASIKKLVAFYRESNRYEDGRKFLAMLPFDTSDSLRIIGECYLTLGCFEEGQNAIKAAVEFEGR